MKQAALAFLMSVALIGCGINHVQSQLEASSKSDQGTDSAIVSEETVYKNTQYGFEFSLPDSWKGYTVVQDKWEGAADEAEQPKTAEAGVTLLLRHPQWRSEKLRQDIPIMVFTLAQWESLTADKFHIGAAPMNPSEIGRNSKYVFAIPARYNYAFPEGYEEVEQVLKGTPLKATENFAVQ